MDGYHITVQKPLVVPMEDIHSMMYDVNLGYSPAVAVDRWLYNMEWEDYMDYKYGRNQIIDILKTHLREQNK